jgi:hypothetical protein
VIAVTLLAGMFMVAAEAWALLGPGSFADAVAYPRHTHFVHDLGAFQLGIGVALLLAATWRDGLALALAGLLVANTIHPHGSTTPSTWTSAVAASTPGGWPSWRCWPRPRWPCGCASSAG